MVTRPISTIPQPMHRMFKLKNEVGRRILLHMRSEKVPSEFHFLLREFAAQNFQARGATPGTVYSYVDRLSSADLVDHASGAIVLCLSEGVFDLLRSDKATKIIKDYNKEQSEVYDPEAYGSSINLLEEIAKAAEEKIKNREKKRNGIG